MLLTDKQWKIFQGLDPVVIVGGLNISAYRTEVLETMSVDKEKFSEEDRIKIINVLERRRKDLNHTDRRTEEILQKRKPLITKQLEFQDRLVTVINEVHSMLLEKNRKYGNSVSEPVGVFSKLSSIEAINVRIDDKLSRIRSGQPDETEDSELDLIGYLILKRILRYEQKPE